MSYSFVNKCGKCTKNETCADGKIIQGAIDTIHAAPLGLCDDSWHKGSGVVRHDCDNFVEKKD